MTKHSLPGQLGFDALLLDAEEQNRQRQFERETGHLPSTMEEGLGFFRGLLGQHHAAMLAADMERVMALREEADRLALRLNGGDSGILAGDDSAGRVLERETAAPVGAVPIWGQKGDFIIDVNGMKVRIEIEGVFGIGSGFAFWPGFSAHAVERDKPFLSETGYRSFLGVHAEPAADMTPDSFVRAVIETHVAKHLKGKLLRIEERYVKRGG
jgi:hypothetical protein